ncbi:MAG: response regulator [Deltaproteobacteria bacterium]|nr:response regulator [Deltaproteobacteria bacterium]
MVGTWGSPSSVRVLVVDDDRSLREAIARVLEEEGYSVLQAENGAQALDHVRAAKPAAVVLDVMMPVMDGRRFLEELRREPSGRDVRVVVMTHMPGVDSTKASNLGVDDVLAKPFRVDELLNKIALATFRAMTRELPNQRDPTPVPQPTELERTPGGGIRVPMRGTVLVVDDDRNVLSAMDTLLTQEGYTVIPVARCDANLPRLARALEPKAVIVDLRMPIVSGMTVLRWLRAEPALDNVPILVLSGDDRELHRLRDEIATYRAAVHEKPIKAEELLEFLTEPPLIARRDL